LDSTTDLIVTPEGRRKAALNKAEFYLQLYMAGDQVTKGQKEMGDHNPHLKAAFIETVENQLENFTFTIIFGVLGVLSGLIIIKSHNRPRYSNPYQSFCLDDLS